MIQKLQSISNNIQLSDKIRTSINPESCSPVELEIYVISMYESGEISLKDTLIFRPLDLKPLAADLGIDVSGISLKYFSKVYNEPNVKRNLYRDYKSILNQMVINRESSKNVSMMKRSVEVLDMIKNTKSFGSIYKSLFNTSK